MDDKAERAARAEVDKRLENMEIEAHDNYDRGYGRGYRSGFLAGVEWAAKHTFILNSEWGK